MFFNAPARTDKSSRYRQGKKQILVYLDPDQSALFERLMQAYGWSAQDALGVILNCFVGYHGVEPFFDNPAPSSRARPTSSRARPMSLRSEYKTEGMVADNRVGKRTVAGWFDEPQVFRCKHFVREVGKTMQAAVEIGIGLMMRGAG